MKSIPAATPIILTRMERRELEALANARKSEARMRERARIVLLAAAGHGSRAIGRELHCTPGTVSKWRVRYARDRLAGLSETGERGAEAKYGPEHARRILALLDRPPPAGYANWTALLMARELVDIHEQYIWRFLRARKIDLSGRKSWCQSNDPDFVAKAAEIVGLYMNPPDNAIVLSVDEKPSIEALERAQGYLKLPNGRAMTGQSHDYKRHGTTTLFAALNVGTGAITARHYKRRRRLEFLDFMNRVVAQHEGKELHVILDNLSTHKPKRDLWLARHPNVHFHYTPTHASWLNQVEIWFSILEADP
jgi:transposase